MAPRPARRDYPRRSVHSSRIHLIAHGLAVLLIDAAALMILSELLPGFVLDGPVTALGAALAIGVLNALVLPLIARLTVPLSVATLGLGSLLLNAALVGVAITVVPGATMAGPLEAVAITVLVTVLTLAISALLSIDQDETWYRNVVLGQLRRDGRGEESEQAGILFVEIDGLAHEVLRRALANGNAPTLARWVREGSHSLRSWETDWSSQTGACQAGILHGDNSEMPAFRWWDKEAGGRLICNHPHDATELERRRSDGRGLLHDGGASRANIFSGDAPHSMLTISTMLERRGLLGRDYSAYFARPYAVVRTVVMALVEIVRERRTVARQREMDVRPRVERTRTYALIRAWATVVQADLQVSTVVSDLLAGRTAIYTTFLAYDEVAHHSGIERPDTLSVLRRVDRQIARLERACAAAPRPYELVVLADHGQSQGETFSRRYGITLEELVRDLLEGEESEVELDGEEGDEGGAYLRAGIAESGADRFRAGHSLIERSRRNGGSGSDDGRPDDGSEATPDADAGEERLPEISVMASGCVGVISFPRIAGRASLEQIEELHPRLIEGLRVHPGIGFVLVDSERYGALVLGPEGAHELEHDRTEGEDPLAPFGENARRHVLRTSRFANCPDIVVNSAYRGELDEVASFEELVGSHGGLGGSQSRPFVLHPARLEWPAEPVIGAESIHRIFRGWLAALGNQAYAEEAGDARASPGAAGSSTSGAPAG